MKEGGGPQPAPGKAQQNSTCHASGPKEAVKSERTAPQVGDVVGGYLLNEKIGQGSFGVVFTGYKDITQRRVAIKVETCTETSVSQLENEYETYKQLKGFSGFPKIEKFGDFEGYKYLVMEHLGVSIEDMHNIRNRHFCIKTVFMLGKRMVDLVELLHSIGKIHRDIKPDNFLVGRDPKKLFLVDLGMCKGYIRNGQHLVCSSGKRLTGTPRYASINSHRGLELSRRDDLESIGYVMIYLANGRLPWQGIKMSKREKCKIIGDMKKNLKIEEMTKNLPGSKRIVEYFAYVRELEFDSTPDYGYLRSLMDKALLENNLVDDGVFEWEHVFKDTGEETHRDTPEKERSVMSRIKKAIFCCFK